MANVLVEERSLQAIADAIRYKIGGTDTYKPREMAPAIRNLPTNSSGESILISKTITANGVYSPSDDSVDGYSIVTVQVPSTGNTLLFQNREGTLSVKITSDGTVKFYFNGYTKSSGDVSFFDV